MSDMPLRPETRSVDPANQTPPPTSVNSSAKSRPNDAGLTLGHTTSCDPGVTGDFATYSQTKLTHPPFALAVNAMANLTAAERYVILQSHARGGLGEVFRAFDRELNREVAVKQIQEQHAESESNRTRFLIEAEVTGSLEHPGVVPVYGLGIQQEGRPFYAMRFIRGESLKQALGRFHAHRPVLYSGVEFRQLLSRFIAAANAIAYAHSRGIVHRDLKPANIMLGPFGETLVVDWGLAKRINAAAAMHDASTNSLADAPAMDDNSEITMPGAILGTPSYMSPEQAAGAVEVVGPAIDVYGLGSTLFFVLTGQAPYTGTDSVDVLRQVRAGNHPPVRSVAPNVSQALEAICHKAMATRPIDRYLSALDLTQDIERWLADEPVSAWREPVAVRLRRWFRRHRAGVAALAAAAIIGLISLTAALVAISGKNRKLDDALTLAELRSAQSRELVDSWFTTVSESADLKRSANLQLLRRALLERAQRYYEAAIQQAPTNQLVVAETAAAYERLARIANDLSPGPESLKSIEKAVQLRAELSRNGGPDDRLNLANSLSLATMIFRQQGRHSEATQYADQAVSGARELLSADPDNDKFADCLARALHQLSQVQCETGRRAEELATLKQIPMLAERFRRSGRLSPWIDDLAEVEADSYNAMANALAVAGKPDEVIAFDKRVIAYYEGRLQRDPESNRFQFSLASSYSNLGGHLAVAGKPEQQRAWYEKALVLFEKLAAENPQTPKHLDDLASMYFNLGKLDFDHAPPQALVWFQKALPLQERMVRLAPSVLGYQKRLANTCTCLAATHDRLYHEEESLAFAKQAVAISRSALSRNPHDPQSAHDFALALNSYACFLSSADLPGEADQAIVESLKFWDRLIAERPMQKSLAIDRARSMFNVAKFAVKQGRWDVAIASATSAIESLETGFPLPARPQPAAMMLGYLYQVRAEAKDWLKQPDDSQGDWRLAIELRPKVEHPELYCKRARCLAANGQLQPALAMLESWHSKVEDETEHFAAAMAAAQIYMASRKAKSVGADNLMATKSKQIAEEHLDALEAVHWFDRKVGLRQLRNAGVFSELFELQEFEAIAKRLRSH